MRAWQIAELGKTLTGLTASSSIMLGRSLLDSFPVDWSAAGLDGSSLRELVEHLL